jgi:hypothetical protein
MKKLAWVALVSLLALAVNVVPATAGSEHVALHFTSTPQSCHTNATPPNPAPNSFVMLNTAGKPGTANPVIANIQLKDGAPNTTYDVFVNGPAAGGGCPATPNGGTLTTDANGHGHTNVKVSGIDAPGSPHDFQVQLNARVGGLPGPFPAEFTSDLAFLD